MAATVINRPPPTGEGLTYEKVWAMFQETDRKFKETEQLMKENAERQKETERQMKESAERLDRQLKESAERLDKQLGKLGNRFGEMVEYMVMPNLITKFRELGFVFTKAYPHSVIEDEENGIYAEVDITLENGDKVMIVEVKSKPTTKDITEHIERMRKVRLRADLQGDKRKYLGAVAGMIFNKDEKAFAMRKGFYVIEPSGEIFIITVPKGRYRPKEW